MLDILLIRPPNLNARYSFVVSSLPLNLMYLSASLKQHNMKVHILEKVRAGGLSMYSQKS